MRGKGFSSTVIRLISADWVPHTQRSVRSCLCLASRVRECPYRILQTRILLPCLFPLCMV